MKSTNIGSYVEISTKVKQVKQKKAGGGVKMLLSSTPYRHLPGHTYVYYPPYLFLLPDLFGF